MAENLFLQSFGNCEITNPEMQAIPLHDIKEKSVSAMLLWTDGTLFTVSLS